MLPPVRADARGAVAIEFAVAGLVLAGGILNAIDVGNYIYRRMEVEYAADVGAQQAWKNCSSQSSYLPATQNCAGLNGAVTAAIQSTSLGAAVSLASGYPEEGDYCINASSALQCVGSLSNLLRRRQRECDPGRLHPGAGEHPLSAAVSRADRHEHAGHHFDQ
jgi:uncharacterized membrane protein